MRARVNLAVQFVALKHVLPAVYETPQVLLGLEIHMLILELEREFMWKFARFLCSSNCADPI